MKSFFVVALLVAAAAAAPANPDADAQIVRYDSDNIGVDGFNYAFETSNGIRQEEQGQRSRLTFFILTKQIHLSISKMKSFMILALFAVAALASPVEYKDATILRQNLDNIGVDGYNYAVETSDGKRQEEQGQLVNPGTENEALVVRGSYSYTGPDGVVYTVTYVADQNGFQPQGAHIPQA
ncbi:unnamed protein product [Plutella xylostella]|uniref:(diamondback moth) hypothetical protein n=2 Tax=Plutella xylostella TaxID=51655 RepID=A0A8S4G9B1_PLUXY|nr:unnamed protein product [Plutella xylostella]